MTYFYLILCIVVALFVFCCGLFFHYIGQHPEALEDEPQPAQTPYDSYEIQALINERWRIQAAIRNCTTLKDMGRLYWEIEELEDWYKDRVPDQFLIVHADELFAFHTQKALELRQVLA